MTKLGLIAAVLALGSGAPASAQQPATPAKPAAPPRDKAKVLRAKPVKGEVEVDWAELSREHIARYPKIRARLAE